MKYITQKIIILIAIFGSIELRGQSCVQDISTRPSNPVNTQMESLFSGNVNPWKNTFNVGAYILQSFNSIQINPNAGWQVPDWTGGPFLMTNPFDGSNGYEYLSKPGQLPGVKDYHWEDGWELMWLGTGYYPNGEEINTVNTNRIVQTSSNLAHNRVPYMVYYNRYTGRLRIFSSIFTDLGTFGDIYTSIGHADGIGTTFSGTFRHVNGYDQALDQYTKNHKIQVYNKNFNNSTLW
jgi:hypothetical protein